MKRRIMSILIAAICVFTAFYTYGTAAVAETNGINSGIAVLLNKKVHKLLNIGSGRYLTVDAGLDENDKNVYQKSTENNSNAYKSQEFRFEFIVGSTVRIHPVCSNYGRHRVLSVDAQNNSSSELIAGRNIETYAPTKNYLQYFNVTEILVEVNGGNRRILSDDEVRRVIAEQPNNESPNTQYVKYYRFTLKHNTNLALTAYGDGNGSASGTSSTSTGNVYIDTVNTNSYYQLWSLESSDVNAEEAYYTGLSPTYPLSSSYSYISSGYGNRGDAHYGIDIPAPEGTNIVSMFDGTVKQWGCDSRGYYIIIESNYYVYNNQNYKIRFVYMHLCELPQTTNPTLQVDSAVTAGTLVGKVGGTPSYAPHLHLSIIVDIDNNNITNGYYDTVNPMAFFANHAFTFNNY